MRLLFGRHRTPGAVSMCLVALVAGACAKAPPPLPSLPPVTVVIPPEANTETSVVVAASPDVNPNDEGRPSPIVVRIYQLRDDMAFRSASFSRLYDDEQNALGQDLISRQQVALAPGEQRNINVRLAKDARFVGAVAAFRQMASARWRETVAAPQNGLKVAVEGTRLVLSAIE